jgi:hypothetical protein
MFDSWCSLTGLVNVRHRSSTEMIWWSIVRSSSEKERASLKVNERIWRLSSRRCDAQRRKNTDIGTAAASAVAAWSAKNRFESPVKSMASNVVSRKASVPSVQIAD